MLRCIRARIASKRLASKGASLSHLIIFLVDISGDLPIRKWKGKWCAVQRYEKHRMVGGNAIPPEGRKKGYRFVQLCLEPWQSKSNCTRTFNFTKQNSLFCCNVFIFWGFFYTCTALWNNWLGCWKVARYRGHWLHETFVVQYTEYYIFQRCFSALFASWKHIKPRVESEHNSK